MKTFFWLILVALTKTSAQQPYVHSSPLLNGKSSADSPVPRADFKDSMLPYLLFCDNNKPTGEVFTILNFSNNWALENPGDSLQSIAEKFATSYLNLARGLRERPGSSYYATRLNQWGAFFRKLGIPADLFDSMGATYDPTQEKLLAKYIRQKLRSIDPYDCSKAGGFITKKSGCKSMILRFTNGDEINVGSFQDLNGDNKTEPGTQRSVYVKEASGQGAALCSVN